MASQQNSILCALALWAVAGLVVGCASAAADEAKPTRDQPEKPSPNHTDEPTETLILRKTRLANGAATLEPKTTPTHLSNPSPIPPGLRYLALGDSYTIGEKVADGERFPAQLTKRLRARGIEMRSPQIVARTGWTTSDLIAGIAGLEPQIPFDLVTLLIGVNNQYRGLGLELYQRELSALVVQAVDLAGGEPERVIVISIPDWGVMPYARNFDRALIGQQIDSFNNLSKEIAIAKGVRYANITPLSRKAGEDAALATTDGLHPSAKQYQQWVDLIFPEALAALGQ